MSEFWLSDEQFERLRPLLPDKVRGVARVDDRRVISGIIHVVKSGGRWVDAPACYGPRKTLYNRFVRSKRGTGRRREQPLESFSPGGIAMPPGASKPRR